MQLIMEIRQLRTRYLSNSNDNTYKTVITAITFINQL